MLYNVRIICYNSDNKLIHSADKWAIENLIPKSELIKAIKKNLDSIYLLAQHFDVSEDFMIKACRYYGVYFG